MICEAFNPGYSEEEVATIVDDFMPIDEPARQGLRSEDKVEVVRRIIHQRTAASAIRPCKGHLANVCIKPITLSDFIFPDSWTRVTRKKKRKVRPVAARRRR